jgi:hypothetical protein
MALAAALLTTIGSSIGGLVLRPALGVPITVAGFACAAIAAMKPDRNAPRRLLPLAFAAMLVVGVRQGPESGSAPWFFLLCRTFWVLAAGVVLLFFRSGPRWRRRAALTAAAMASALFFVAPIGVPHPAIDVWNWTEVCGEKLLAGVHPYMVGADSVPPSPGYWGYTSTIFPYMPAVLLIGAPAIALLHDYRFMLALCFVSTILLVRALGRRYPDRAAAIDVVTLALALHPRGPSLLANGFTEPFLMLPLAGFVYLTARGRDIPAAVSFLMTSAVKQYVLAPGLLFVAWCRNRTALLVGIGVAAATVVPFLVTHARATFDGIAFMMEAPVAFRRDSDSIVAGIAILTGLETPRWLGVAVQLAAAAAAYPLVRRGDTGGLLLASALSLFAGFLFATQAFANYYVFVSGLLLFAAIVGVPAAEPYGAKRPSAVPAAPVH